MVSLYAYAALIVATAIERLVEVRVSLRNAQWSFNQGGVEHGAGHYPFMPNPDLKQQSICLDGSSCFETGKEWMRPSAVSKGLGILPGAMWRQACFIGNAGDSKQSVDRQESGSQTWFSFFGLERAEETMDKSVKESSKRVKKDKTSNSEKEQVEQEKSRFRILRNR